MFHVEHRGGQAILSSSVAMPRTHTFPHNLMLLPRIPVPLHGQARTMENLSSVSHSALASHRQHLRSGTLNLRSSSTAWDERFRRFPDGLSFHLQPNFNRVWTRNSHHPYASTCLADTFSHQNNPPIAVGNEHTRSELPFGAKGFLGGYS